MPDFFILRDSGSSGFAVQLKVNPLFRGQSLKQTDGQGRAFLYGQRRSACLLQTPADRFDVCQRKQIDSGAKEGFAAPIVIAC